tara:strand:- start:15643 stop:16458 length:816 start_codon:yes stop_codon:yes gene_type:complete
MQILTRIYKKFRSYFNFRRAVSDTNAYKNFCKLAANNDEVFKTFRCNPTYMKVLEHVYEDLGKKYYSNIKKTYSYSDNEIFDICKVLHKPGNPKLLEINDNLQPISPTSLRYLNTALQIKDNFKEKNIKNIIEIGPGYGGQSVILNKFFQIDSYTYVDLKEVNLLIEKFISNFDLNFSSNFLTLSDNFEKSYDLIISNFAFSELPRNLQTKALKKIISKSTYGFMIMNSHRFVKNYNFHTDEELLRFIPNFTLSPEVPNTSPNGENYLLTF